MLFEHIGWIILRINFLDYKPLLSMDEVVFDVNMLSPFKMELIIS